jgi:hypothetical protein
MEKTCAYDVVCVASGIYSKKNSYKDYNTENLYLNYGLLGLTTNLHDKGYAVRMYQADGSSPEEVLEKIEKDTVFTDKLTLFLSVPSFYNVRWAARFARIFRRKFSNNIIAGGRWVVDKNLDWVKNKIPEVDFFIKGCPDDMVEKFLDRSNWKNYSGICRYTKPFSHLAYPVLADFKKYQPIIEVSRGCNGGCLFCGESMYLMCRHKTPQEVLYEAEIICRDYETEDLNFYFEGAIFSPDISWAKEFRDEYKRRKMKFKFRMQSRVDVLSPETLPVLAGAGLKVLDVGLESASPIQLRRMGKTGNPKVYLERAEKLIKMAAASGVWCKLNILLYAGETLETLKETEIWLSRMKNYFKGISCNPLMLYLNGEDTEGYINEIEQLSQIPVDRKLLYERGYVQAELSDALRGERLSEVTNALYAKFMSREAYMDLKKITYTPRS